MAAICFNSPCFWRGTIQFTLLTARLFILLCWLQATRFQSYQSIRFLTSNLTYCVSSLGCGGNYHKKCAYQILNNCSDSRHRASTSTSINSNPHSNTLPRPASHGGGWGEPLVLQQSNSLTESIPSLKDRRATWSGRSVWIEPALSGRIQVPHTFAIHSYKKPTVCQICKRLVSCTVYKVAENMTVSRSCWECN